MIDDTSAARGTARTACCISLGCSENMLDGSLIRHYLESNGWTPVDDPAEADVIVVNSCAFTRTMQQDSLRTWERAMAARRPGARVILAGCLPAINRRAVLEAGYRDVLVTPTTLNRLDAVIEASAPMDKVRSGCAAFSSDRIGLSFGYSGRPLFRALFETVRGAVRGLSAVPGLPVPRWLWQLLYLPDHGTELVRISVGCLNRCSFCSIPRAKGTTRSVPADVVVERVRAALQRGKRQIALSCDELGSWGQDLGSDITVLLDRLTALPGDFQLILRNVHPEWLIRYWPGLEPVFRRGRISYAVIPLQSASDSLLAAMLRHHTAAQFLDVVESIRRASPRTILRTHLMVGFPGETTADFEATRRFARRLPVDSFCVHEYSEQEFTPSAARPGKVPPDEIRRRARRLRQVEWQAMIRGFRWRPWRP